MSWDGTHPAHIIINAHPNHPKHRQQTTTLSMLSGESPPTSGTAHIAGFSVTREQAQLRQRIGYCPQFSALIDALTVREHLELFARIKGVPEPRVPGRVRAKMGEMDLLDFADKAAGSLSGGNQRKLSVAIATISDPPVLFLDGACVVRVGRVMFCCVMFVLCCVCVVLCCVVVSPPD